MREKKFFFRNELTFDRCPYHRQTMQIEFFGKQEGE